MKGCVGKQNDEDLVIDVFYFWEASFGVFE